MEFDCCYAVPGPQGVPGTQGCQGDLGAQGRVGINQCAGERGYQGCAGARGPQGQSIVGGVGAPGSVGTPGDRGSVGAHGDRGMQGAQGYQGDVGERGIRGTMGYPGISGLSGNQGAQGAQGSIGIVGFVGDSVDVPFEFTVETQSTGGVGGGTIIDDSAVISNLDTLRFYTAGTTEVDLSEGSAVFNLNPANLISLPGNPTFTPTDPAGDFVYVNTSTGSLFQWDPAILTWRQKTIGRSLVGPPGLIGSQGSQGSQGSVGPFGLGLPGPKGDPVVGSQGAQGKGISGLTGDVGGLEVGAQGYQGDLIFNLAANIIDIPYFIHTMDSTDSASLVVPIEYVVPNAIIEISNRSDQNGIFEADLLLPSQSAILEATNLQPDDRFFLHVISNHANNQPFRLRIEDELIFFDVNGSISAPNSEFCPFTNFPPYIFNYIKADQRLTINFINYFGDLRGMTWTITHTDL